MPLADFFRQFANEEFEKQVKGFDTEAKKRLLTYTWSGNVRELEKPRDFDPFGQTGLSPLATI